MKISTLLYPSRVVFPIPCKIELSFTRSQVLFWLYHNIPLAISQEKNVFFFFFLPVCYIWWCHQSKQGYFLWVPQFKLGKVGKVGSKGRMWIPSRIWIGHFLQVPQFKLQKVGKVGSKDRMQISSQNWIEYFLQLPRLKLWNVGKEGWKDRVERYIGCEFRHGIEYFLK